MRRKGRCDLVATMAICVFPVPSVVMSAIALAKRLRRRGHEVWIISTPDVEPAAQSEGIGFVPVLSGLFRTGSFLEEIRFFSTLSRFGKLRELHRATRTYRAVMDALLVPGANELDAAFDRVKPDLVLCYSDIPNLVLAPLVALRRGLKCAYVTPIFSSYRGPSSPPLSTDVVPRPGVWGRFIVRATWARLLMMRRISWRISIWLGFDVDLHRYLRAMGPTRGQPGWPVNWDCFLAPKLTLPEFFLAPRALEFDFTPHVGSHWMGWCVDDDRVEDQPFPVDRLDPSRPLVYCAFGTQFLAFVGAARRREFLQAVIDAMAARPHLQLALATGGSLEGGELALNAPDAIVAERLPQLRVLDHARMMITHCGLHSFMECASRGVPILAYPLGYDQFGNSARVLYHGLGLRGEFATANADSIGRLIDAVLADTTIHSRCAAMAERAKRSERDDEALTVLVALSERIENPENSSADDAEQRR